MNMGDNCNDGTMWTQLKSPAFCGLGWLPGCCFWLFEAQGCRTVDMAQVIDFDAFAQPYLAVGYIYIYKRI